MGVNIRGEDRDIIVASDSVNDSDVEKIICVNTTEALTTQWQDQKKRMHLTCELGCTGSGKLRKKMEEAAGSERRLVGRWHEHN